jgi:hypothetical protein
MDEGPLVTERISAGEEFLKEFDKVYPVESAFWLKKPTGRWSLYVASKSLENVTRDAYGEVIRIVRTIKNPFIESDHITLRRVTDSPVKYALGMKRWNQGYVFPAELFGNIEVEAAYIYPPLHASAVG